MSLGYAGALHNCPGHAHRLPAALTAGSPAGPAVEMRPLLPFACMLDLSVYGWRINLTAAQPWQAQHATGST